MSRVLPASVDDADDFAARGFLLVPSVLTSEECEALAAQLAGAAGSAGTRCLLPQPWCAALAQRVRCHPSIAALIPSRFVPVQCTLFEKSSARNWLVAVHQDLSIPVAARVDHPALQGWSEKEGGLFVQAPAQLLQQLVAVRLHIDDCTAIDGPLRVVAGSHRGGRLEAEVAAAARRSGIEHTCTAVSGSALVMRPLLLHASSKSTGTSRRRVLHFLFGPRKLPFGLSWPQMQSADLCHPPRAFGTTQFVS